MYTPQEVQDKKFPKAVFGGYDMGEVDDFLDAVSTDYTALYKENAVLKSKMKVLAEKVEEYRSVDAAMRKALIVAQKMASEMTEEAKAKSDEIRNKARIDYENSIAALKDDIGNEERRLDHIREETKKYVEASIRVCQGQIESLKQMLTEPAQKREKFEETADAIEKTVYQAITDAIEAKKVSPPEIREVEQEPADELESSADLDIAELTPIEISTDDLSAETEDDEADYDPDYKQISPYIEEDFGQDSSAQASADAAPAKHKIPVKETGKAQEVNIGGMNIRVFEMDLGGDKSSKSGRQ